jgi:putative chitinase
MDATPPYVTASEICAIMPHCELSKAADYETDLNKAMAEFEINTPQRQAAFLAQLAHESAEFRFFTELSSGVAYEHRTDLGNYKPGDGPRFKGRGPIQLTGRRNYRDAGLALGLDLESHPEQAAEPAIGFRTAAWYWSTHGLNALADETATDPAAFDRITRAINGGLNGKAFRDAYFAKALRLAALAAPALPETSEGVA